MSVLGERARCKDSLDISREPFRPSKCHLLPQEDCATPTGELSLASHRRYHASAAGFVDASARGYSPPQEMESIGDIDPAEMSDPRWRWFTKITGLQGRRASGHHAGAKPPPCQGLPTKERQVRAKAQVILLTIKLRQAMLHYVVGDKRRRDSLVHW